MADKLRTNDKLQRRSHLSLKIALIFGPILLLAFSQIKATNAILNCFTPNMFKMNKGNNQVYSGAERASWYPQQYPNQMVYGQSPMRSLFQPKWKMGSSLFGGKGWNNWKMGANSNFYRPNYNYGYSQTIPAPGGTYAVNEQLNVAPFALPPPPSVGSYSSFNSDGWSAPAAYNHLAALPIQQSQLNYDSYSQMPAAIKQQQVISPTSDPYSSKGANNNVRYTSTTTKNNILLADGGYGLESYLPGSLKNLSFGYSYPDWYSGTVDSPAKIAQQLIRHGGLRKLRLQEQNKSAALIGDSGSIATSGQFAILDEPRFVGFGTVDNLSNNEARLSCSFREAIDQTNRPVWIKFLGPYNSSQTISPRAVPPFNCANSQCRTQEIESTKDYRYKFDNGPATSTLIISDPKFKDYGIYRCSALTKAINNNPLETIYQIVQFGVL